MARRPPLSSVEDRCLDRRSGAHPCPPFGDGRVALPNAAQPQQLKPQNIGDRGTIRVGKGIAAKYGPPFRESAIHDSSFR